jgi:hypothetical protein
MLEPSFAISFKEIKDKFSPGTKFSARSTIILGGDAVPEKKSFIVDGTLVARSKINFFDHFNEEFVTFEPVQPDDPEIY